MYALYINIYMYYKETYSENMHFTFVVFVFSYTISITVAGFILLQLKFTVHSVFAAISYLHSYTRMYTYDLRRVCRDTYIYTYAYYIICILLYAFSNHIY